MFFFLNFLRSTTFSPLNTFFYTGSNIISFGCFSKNTFVEIKLPTQICDYAQNEDKTRRRCRMISGYFFFNRAKLDVLCFFFTNFFFFVIPSILNEDIIFWLSTFPNLNYSFTYVYVDIEYTFPRLLVRVGHVYSFAVHTATAFVRNRRQSIPAR